MSGICWKVIRSISRQSVQEMIAQFLMVAINQVFSKYWICLLTLKIRWP